jgi:O-acetyl-ADP-ribose deacetylase (regulator of RNase III)
MSEVGFLYGNLLDFPYGINTIAHCCNTMNVMGAGIAKSIAIRYPQAKEADDECAKIGQNDLGERSFAEFEIEENDFNDSQQLIKVYRKCKIYNLYTQDGIGFGREVNYEALYRNLLLMRNSLNNDSNCVLGLPYGMSSGLAGGSWQIVKAMIDTIFATDAAYFKTYIVKYEVGS